MSNLGFELWWAGDTTILLTTQHQVGSQGKSLHYLGFEPNYQDIHHVVRGLRLHLAKKRSIAYHFQIPTWQ
jgi:hypothetical protein